MRIVKSSRSFRKEFKKQLRFAITAAIGFSVAFAWRNAVYDSLQSVVVRSLDILPGHYLTEIYTAFFITLLGVIFIFLTAKALRD